MTFCEQIKESPAELMEIAFGLARFSSYKIDNEYANAEASLKQNRSLANLSSTLNLGQLNSSKRMKELVKPETIRISNRISPKSLHNSGILNWQLLEILWEWLPDRLMVSEPVVLFNMTEHGNSLSTFYSRSDQWEPTLLIVKTLKHEVNNHIRQSFDFNLFIQLFCIHIGIRCILFDGLESTVSCS